jgi:AcrR family transcriptional regulator
MGLNSTIPTIFRWVSRIQFHSTGIEPIKRKALSSEVVLMLSTRRFHCRSNPSTWRHIGSGVIYVNIVCEKYWKKVVDVFWITPYTSDMMKKPRMRPSGPTLKDKQSAKTKAALIKAAKKLFAEYGYHNVSVTDIARAAGVSHSMINTHFNAKAGLLYQIIHESNAVQTKEAADLAQQGGTVTERLERIFRSFAEHDLKDPDLLAVMQSYFWVWPQETEAENREQLAEALAPARQVLEDGVASGALKADLDLDRAIRAIFAIYTMGLRPAVYDGASIDDCVAEIMAQVTLLL